MPKSVSGRAFNAGPPPLNHQICTLGQHIAHFIPSTRLDTIEMEDRRNYRVCFERIQRVLGFLCERSLASGIEEIFDAIRSGEIADFATEQFHNQSALRGLVGGANRGIMPLGRSANIVRGLQAVTMSTPKGEILRSV